MIIIGVCVYIYFSDNMEIVVDKLNLEGRLTLKVKSTDTIAKVKKNIQKKNDIQQPFHLVLYQDNFSASNQNNKWQNLTKLKN